MPETYRASLVGCGRMGATIDDEVKDRPDSKLYMPYSHAAALEASSRTDFIAVCDPIAEKVAQIQQRYNVPKKYTDYREMIRREQPDIVCIATRPGPHAEIATFAAENGVRGIYCEKPLCNSMRQADAILEACERYGVKFNYGTQRRYVALYQHVRQMIDTGELGDIQAIIAHCGVGAAQWGHTHAADMMLFLASDSEVDYVQGDALTEPEDWDGDRLKKDAAIALGYVVFKNGVRAYLVGSSGYEFEVSGTKGKVRTTDNGQGYTWRQPDEYNRLIEVDGPEAPIESGTLKGIDNLANALDTDGDTQGNIHLACRSQEIILGLIESHRQGGARVSLPLVNRDLAIAPDNY
jgi:predicted dehydrogenase